MKGHRFGGGRLAALVLLLAAAGGATAAAQVAPDVAELRASLAGRYDIVPLRQGVALVPRDPAAGVEIIQVSGGEVTVDGEPVTGGELSARLGADAALVVQISYLDADGLRALGGGQDGLAPPLPPAAPAAPAPPAVPRPRLRDGDRVRMGGGVTVPRGETVLGNAVAIFGPSRIDGDVNGDSVTIFGPADIDGEIFGDLVVVMGSARIGPRAVVHGQTTVVGGSIDRAAGAQLLGGVNEVGVGFGQLSPVPRGPRGFGGGPFGFFQRIWDGAGVPTIIRAILLVLIGLIAVAVARGPIERVAAQGRTEALRAGLVGLLAEILFLPVLIVTLIVLAVSVVGIPLIALVPFGVLGVVVLMLVGFSGTAYAVGRAVLGRLGWEDRGAYVTVAIGVVAIFAVTLLARLAQLGVGVLGAPLAAIGWLVEYAAWTVGFGAVILTLMEWRHRPAAPLEPPPPPPVPGEA